MSQFLSNPKTRAQAAFILCFPLAAISLLSLIGIDLNSWLGNPGILSWIWMGMMLLGLWLYGAPTGLSVLIGLLSTIPFVVLEWVNRRDYAEDFPFVLFGMMWLMAAVSTAILAPIIKDMRAGKSLKSNWVSLLVRGVILVGVVIGWASLVADQMPCFLGVRYCD